MVYSRAENPLMRDVHDCTQSGASIAHTWLASIARWFSAIVTLPGSPAEVKLIPACPMGR